MPGLDLTVLILTYNEEKHLARCIGSVKTLANRVVVIDSASTDRTVDLAKALGADVYQNRWVNHAAQFNWALDNTSISTKWIVRLDADEIVSSELADMLLERLPSIAESTAGLTVNRRIYFLNKWIRHGGLYPARMLRIFRRGKGRCEQRWMDEHILVSGTVQNLEADICDMNLNSVSWWISKHNEYALREAIDALQQEHPVAWRQSTMSDQARRKRWIKGRIYYRLPLGLRSGMYFFYRYFMRLGFLDGWPGLAFHALQGFWYRFLVDVNIYEISAAMKRDGLTLQEVLSQRYGKSV